MRATPGLLACILAAMLSSAGAAAAPFDALYAFGDSLSDAGDNPGAVLSISRLLGGCDPGHRCPPYDAGRYSNGPTAAERLADSALSTEGVFAGFAVAGSTTGVGNFGDGGTATTPGAHALPGMTQQIAAHAAASGGVADPRALYFVWGGGNDFLTGDSPTGAARNVAEHVAALASMGARRLLVPNLPDLSLTPFAQTAGLQAPARAFSLGFNDTLAAELARIEAATAARIIAFDTFSFVDEVVADPQAFGFANATDACLSTFGVCADPDTFVFWDGFHPTAAAHAMIGAAFARSLSVSVPEPGSASLIGLALAYWMSLRAAARRRSSSSRAKSSARPRYASSKTRSSTRSGRRAPVPTNSRSIIHASDFAAVSKRGTQRK